MFVRGFTFFLQLLHFLSCPPPPFPAPKPPAMMVSKMLIRGGVVPCKLWYLLALLCKRHSPPYSSSLPLRGLPLFSPQPLFLVAQIRHEEFSRSPAGRSRPFGVFFAKRVGVCGFGKAVATFDKDQGGINRRVRCFQVRDTKCTQHML